MGGLAELWRSDRLVRLAPVGAVAYSALLPVVQVMLAFGYMGNDTRTGLWSLAAVVTYLPLHLRHVWYAAHARRPPAGVWTFTVMAAVILGVTPLAGNMWPRSYAALVVSALLLVWLPAALTRLRAARELLAQQAVAQERRRLDDDLRRSLGRALESIAARGEQAGRRLGGAVPEGLSDELAALADAVPSCTITVTSTDGRLRLELRTGEATETIEIPA
ncbi:hypothetical protein AB0L65_52015 [Nonomuraea sp. NPDC052116]|uniref:hypothetical protein n=1 Tax=Nonomuraea sp. NPDC052116 TaxID=3155665 RepID=UPI00342FEA0F